MKRVFVSYSRNNLDVVNQLVQDMQAVGVQAWHCLLYTSDAADE